MMGKHPNGHTKHQSHPSKLGEFYFNDYAEVCNGFNPDDEGLALVVDLYLYCRCRTTM